MSLCKSILLSCYVLIVALTSVTAQAADYTAIRVLVGAAAGFPAAMSQGVKSIAETVARIEPAAGPSIVATPNLQALQNNNRPVTHGAFASVAIPVGNIAMANKWQRVTARDYSAFFTTECSRAGFANCNTGFARSMRQLHANAGGLSQVAQIRMVNQQINGAITYKSDQANWGTGDHWATPSEIARNGAGDCEDYAIAKMWMLRSLGFSPEQLQLTVLQDTRRQLYHAVLVVHIGGERYILDNLSNTARLDSAINNYMPLVSFVGAKSFIHGFDQRRSMTAAMPADLGAVNPGEGV